MSKVITFSRAFPAHHPKKGKPTYFVEKILNSVDKHNHYFVSCSCGWMGSSSAMEGGGPIADTGDFGDPYCPKCSSLHWTDIEVVSEDYYLGKFQPKRHTIRAGNRWKVGDKFSPRVWSGRPYASKQITIAPDIEIKKIWDIKIFAKANDLVNGKPVLYFQFGNQEPYRYGSNLVGMLAANDGLELIDFRDWFNIHPKKQGDVFRGQILCWDDSVNY